MKKFLVILFSAFYLFSSAGVMLNLHFCGGKVKSISLHHTDETDCCKGKMKKKGCCKETSAFVKIKDTQASSKSIQLPAHQALDLIASAETSIAYSLSAGIDSFLTDRAPPDLYQPPSYLLHRVFLI